MDQTAAQHTPVEFTGSAAEYFKIWIVNVALTLVTLGIYSAWAKVRTMRYFYGNTRADGHHFEYLADPLPILKGRIIAVVALGAYYAVWQFYPTQGLYALGVLMVLMPAVFVLAVGFQLRNTAYRNIRFDFERRYLEAYGLLLGPALIVATMTWIAFMWWSGSDMAAMAAAAEDGTALGPYDLLPTFFLLALAPLLPYLDFLRSRFTASHASYGSQRMSFHAGAGAFYLITVLTWLLFVPLGMLLGAGMGIAAIPPAEGSGAPPISMPIVTLTLVLFYGAAFWVWGYYGARRRNLLYNNLAIGTSRVHSRLRARGLGWLYLSNTVAIVVSLGLMIPWARVRFAKYLADCTSLELHALETVSASSDDQRTAIGEEVGDAFGFEVGF